MIDIHYAQSGDTHELQISGHAGYSRVGNDIVCAGVSAIAYTLLGFLENQQDDITAMCGPATSDGELYVSCCGGPHIALGFEMAIIGLSQIANKYPDHVKIHISAAGGGSREKTADF